MAINKGDPFLGYLSLEDLNVIKRYLKRPESVLDCEVCPFNVGINYNFDKRGDHKPCGEIEENCLIYLWQNNYL